MKVTNSDTLTPCLASGVVPRFGSLRICSLPSCLLHGLALLFLSLISSWTVFQIHPQTDISRTGATPVRGQAVLRVVVKDHGALGPLFIYPSPSPLHSMKGSHNADRSLCLLCSIISEDLLIGIAPSSSIDRGAFRFNPVGDFSQGEMQAFRRLMAQADSSPTITSTSTFTYFAHTGTRNGEGD
ncbi:Intracellular hyaluronan-binding protein like [Actinidia chinensis var. chinensis]|uniref:Intracellular hyaluronan-binding protein like n=1 Tax=Actinidia chinensis var. chinensis TaxID=1590841 RepID=A0A2R6PWK6_ACTCC|nr:Intracellular hyaluronan-binding protein like [Actinidia chinensis var. chinensis]